MSTPCTFYMKGLTSIKSCATAGRTAPGGGYFHERRLSWICWPVARKFQGHWRRNCTKDLILLVGAAKPKRGKSAASRIRPTDFPRAAWRSQGEDRTEIDGPPEWDGTRRGTALFIVHIFLNKIRVLCLFAGWGLPQAGGHCFFRGRRAAARPRRSGMLTSCASPAPGGGGGREGERGRPPGGSGESRTEGQGQRRRGQSGATPPPRRRRGRRNAHDPQRPKGRRGGDPQRRAATCAAKGGGEPAARGGGTGPPRPPRSGPRAAPTGRGRAIADPRRGPPMRPPY